MSTTYSYIQVLWIASASITKKESDTQQIEIEKTAICSLYDLDKQVKLLMPAITSPKIAGVLHLKYPVSDSKIYKKTAFFGNAAPPETAISVIENNLSENKIYFKLYTPDHEEVEIALPPFSTNGLYQQSFFVVKYMPRGQVVYDEHLYEEEKR